MPAPKKAPKADAPTLRSRIHELEEEIVRLTRELEEKKKNGADKTGDIEARINELKAKLSQLVQELMVLEDEARRAKGILTRMQTSHDNHEKLLRSIEEQISQIEAGQRDDVTDMRREL
ncbi:MAG: hypothetical protein HY042_08360, partial [Spirochaetia bacterium]|nr:hypothetical protein [Spirochaetia bacterium]